ncbi:ABC-type transport system involved in multi-copper enzyme maturation permease subunit [Paenibacillus turicensis]|uniref:ABC-type transport system involved in multi-copper enzyme maturation permease subunit n=1 Tax=Paenibacillus turicensis TaxID=160487 RepID=A0ABS4FS58_9BACL|nr:ABC transporter permease [Paenibacillus turicensis]MBP1905423.1 ABC-type transport system involved in multi-copper enzyme maturation permease subunit [Paenibacillus turicensis]
MLNIMKLEMKKYKMRGSVISAFIITFISMAIIILLNFDVEARMGSYDETMRLINNIVSCIFIIFAASLIAKYIISEYKDKTITILFTYPIPRKKIIIAKLLIILAFTFIFGVISKLIIYTAFYLFNQYAHLFEHEMTSALLWGYGVKILLDTLLMSCVSLIPLYFGMRKHSIITTILSSILVASVLYSNVSFSDSNFALSNIVMVHFLVSIIGLLIAYSAIYRIDQKDLV